MPTPRTWLVVAAESREFDGILQRAAAWSRDSNLSSDRKEAGSPTTGSGRRDSMERVSRFVQKLDFRGDRWILIANGPGEKLATEPLTRRIEVDGIISAGFCGALDPSLRVGDIVREVHSLARVAVTAAEKRELRASTGARAVDMESAALARVARSWNVPFHVIRAVSDTAQEDMPLDFNLYRDSAGRFSRSRIALAALAHPFRRVPALLRLDRNCRQAAESLGEYFADCQL